MRLVATLTTGYHVQLACDPSVLNGLNGDGIGPLVREIDQEPEHRWVETVEGAWIRREAIIALHLEHDAA